MERSEKRELVWIKITNCKHEDEESSFAIYDNKYGNCKIFDRAFDENNKIIDDESCICRLAPMEKLLQETSNGYYVKGHIKVYPKKRKQVSRKK